LLQRDCGATLEELIAATDWLPHTTRAALTGLRKRGYQRREIVQGEGEPRSPIRPMRVQARAVFAESLRNAHCWLDELIMDPNQTIELIAARENKSARSIRMTLSLSFIAPPIVAAGVEGRLPRGFGVKRLMDLPTVWSLQWTALGLKVAT
jgi:site-specific DNA recombinase